MPTLPKTSVFRLLLLLAGAGILCGFEHRSAVGRKRDASTAKRTGRSQTADRDMDAAGHTALIFQVEKSG